MDGGGDGGGRCGVGGRRELIETVLTCEGNINDPELPKKLTHLVNVLKHVTRSDCTWFVQKVEPWNSVRVTFSIPREAAVRLHQLAQAGDQALRQLGILSVQVEGDQVISLKLAGANNEPTEIVLRTESTPNDGAGPSSVARSVTLALGGAGLMPGAGPAPPPAEGPVGGQQHFRCPNVVAPVGDSIPLTPRPMTQVRAPYPYASMNNTPKALQGRELQQQPGGASAAVHTAAPSAPRPIYNPPPPYPSLDPSRLRAPGPSLQRPPAPQINGPQFVVTQASTIVQPGPPMLPSVVQASPSQQANVSYAVSATQGLNNRPTPTQAVKVGQRSGGNVLKNSPLLVDLLRQPDHQPGMGVNKAKVVLGGSPHGSPAPASPSSRSTTSTPSSDSLPHTPLTNLPLPAVPAQSPPPANSASFSGAVTVANLPGSSSSTQFNTSYSVRAKDGVHTHQQVYSGGSVITSTVAPHPRLPSAPGGGLQPHPQATGQPPPGQRPPYNTDQRRVVLGNSTPSIHSRVPLHTSGRPSTVGDSRVVPPSPPQFASGGKESQYLINPNTGLLEPRPSESSDSEPEARPPSVNEDLNSNSLVSDEESNLSTASKKETDQSDSEASRVSLHSIESRRSLLSQDKSKYRDRDSSPGSSRENSVVTSGTTGESIKLKLKIGKDSVAQATFVPNAKKGDRKDRISGSISGSQLGNEPRVPKLHIKLNSQQAVIVNPIGDGDTQRSQEKDSSKEDKSKRRSYRNKSRSSESDSDSGKVRGLKMKSSKDRGSEDSASVLKMLDGKKKGDLDVDENPLKVKLKEGLEGRLKSSRTLDDGRISGNKSENSKISKLESKFRTRPKTKTPMRKVGDLNSMGEIASHKILDTLPPSITKVAALHTQQPHINPSSSSSQLQANLSATGSSVSSSVTGSSQSAGDLFKAELEKRGSEIIRKNEDKTDNIVSRLRFNNLSSLMNGDLTHSEKLVLGRVRQKNQGNSQQQQQVDGPSSSKLTIKRKGSGETHTLESLKKDLPEGLGSIPTYLNSSVMINKVSHSPEKLSALRQDEPSDKSVRKVDIHKHTVCTDLASLKANSDITIHSVTKNETLSLGKSSDGDSRSSSKSKSEIKIGRVTHLDVNDRKALQEALKSSQSSTKRNDIHSSSMHDLLKRFNNSTAVPVSSQSESTNSTSGVKVGPKVTDASDKVKQEVKCEEKSESKESHITNVISSSCDTSVKQEPEQQTNTNNNKVLEQVKVPDFPGNVVLTKSEVESPDGTPKGEHGSGQGGEDSGIESMDALSEKSPNQSDQSPSRRDDKECEAFSEKNNADKTTVVSKGETRSSIATSTGGSVSRESKVNVKVEVKVENVEEKDTLTRNSPDKGGNAKCCSLACESRNEIDSKGSIGGEVGDMKPTPQESSEQLPVKIETSSSSEILPLAITEVKSEPMEFVPITTTTTTTTTVVSKECETVASSFSTPHSCSMSTPTTSISVSESTLTPTDSCTVTSSSVSLHATVSTSASFPSLQSTALPRLTVPSTALPSIFSSYATVNSSTVTSHSYTSTNTSLRTVSGSTSPTPSVIVPILNVTSSAPASPTSTSHVSSCSLDTHSYVTTSTTFTPSTVSSIATHTTHTHSLSPVTTFPNVPDGPKTTTSVSTVMSKPSLLALTLTRPQNCSAPSQCSASLMSELSPVDKIASFPTPAEFSSSSFSTSSTNNQPTVTSTTVTTSTSPKVVTLKPSTSQGQVNTSLNLPPGTTFRLVALPTSSAMASTTSPMKVVVSPLKTQISQQVTSGMGGMTVVTVKPVAMATGGAKNSHLLQTLSVSKTEESSPPSLLKAHLTAPTTLTTAAQAMPTSVTNSAGTPIVSSTMANGDDAEDLDFVGFSSTPDVKWLQPSELKREILKPEELNERPESCKSPEVLSPTGEEPTPMRVHPPLYTYGNRERKKDVESDAEEKDKDEVKTASECEGVAEVKCDISELDREKDEVGNLKSKAKDKKFDALSIEIPPTDPTLPDDKRLTRSTRHSARLASPKVSSPGAELSPKIDRKSPACMLTMGKPSPVPVLRPSVSPATRGTKRRRHESESSNASSVNEDTLEFSAKTTRRKPPDKAAGEKEECPKECLKGKATRSRDTDADSKLIKDDDESSEDESLEGGSVKKRNPSAASTSTNEDEDDSRPSSRSSRTSCKTSARSRERQSSAESTGTTRDATPTRRTPRQNNRVPNKEKSPEPNKDNKGQGGQTAKPQTSRDIKDRVMKDVVKEKEVEKKDVLKDSKDTLLKDKRTMNVNKDVKPIVKDKSPELKDKDRSPIQGTKTRKDSELSEPDASNRRKTRSTATANEDTPNKRRRLSKDK